MCDYSLNGLPTRLAVEGERLVSFRFRTGSIGLAPLADVFTAGSTDGAAGGRSWWAALKGWFSPPARNANQVAVCVPPGARLRMYCVAKQLQVMFGIQTVEDVTFIQTTADANQYRDGIEFGNGRKVLLQALPEGIEFDVRSWSRGGGDLEPEDPDAAWILSDFENAIFLARQGRAPAPAAGAAPRDHS